MSVKASSGLSDAKAHADEDKKLAELVHTRNHADGLVHATEKSLKDLGDKVSAEEKQILKMPSKRLKPH